MLIYFVSFDRCEIQQCTVVYNIERKQYARLGSDCPLIHRENYAGVGSHCPLIHMLCMRERYAGLGSKF